MQLPASVFDLYPPLFEAHPLTAVLNDAVVNRPNREAALLAGEAVCQMRVARDPHLVAGLWVYAGDIDAAHSIVQDLPSDAASWWHAIVHRFEGDFSNSRYWYRQASRHPLMDLMGDEPMELVGLAESGSSALPSAQRAEWASLMEWCVQHPA